MTRYLINSSESQDLPNKLGLIDRNHINEEEFVGFIKVAQNAIDELDESTIFSLEYLYNLHNNALGRLYDFAGKLRTVDMSKEGFIFPAAKFLPQNMSGFSKKYLEEINETEWSNDINFINFLASLHAELLYLHPFRDGNGRVIRLFTKLIYLAKTGEELDLDDINQGNNFERYVAAVQEAAKGEYVLMRELFRELQS